MKFLVVFALALATASAFTISEKFETPVHPRDLVKVDSSEVVIEETGDVQGRITNGHTAQPGQIPYQVGLSLSTSNGGFWCGASLLNQNWILTAAHCTQGAYAVTVYLGSTTRTVARVTFHVGSNEIHQHHGYNPQVLANDISLIWIPTVGYSNEIKPVRLPRFNQYSSYQGRQAIASGWGLTAGSNSVANQLQWVSLLVINNNDCANVYGSAVVTGSTLCVMTQGGYSTCSGDSGGPLVTDELIGVTSFVSGAGCMSNHPAGFVRVTAYLDWIRGITGIAYY